MSDDPDWSAATWEGSRRRQHHEFHALPFDEKLAVIESLSEVVRLFTGSRAGAATARTGAPKDGETERPRVLNRSGLIEALGARTGMRRAKARRAIDALFSPSGIIATELKKTRGKVQISGFGSFETRKPGARKGRNPRTGGVVPIEPSSTPVFRPDRHLMDLLNRARSGQPNG